jgi:hypothetical protein
MDMSSGNRNLTDKATRRAKRPQVPDVFNRRMAAYALAAGAAGVTVAAMAASTETTQGPIVFTPAHVILAGLGETHFNIDLNHDGIDDFTLMMTNTLYVQSTQDFFVEGGSFRDDPAAGNGDMLRPLAKGSVIGGAGMFESGKNILAWGRINGHSGHSGYSVRGPWAKTAADSFLGVRFLINGETHYGWVRMTVIAAPYEVNATITGYAYNTVANQPLRAGEGATEANSADTHPATLGALSLGAAGLVLWRKKEQET